VPGEDLIDVGEPVAVVVPVGSVEELRDAVQVVHVEDVVAGDRRRRVLRPEAEDRRPQGERIARDRIVIGRASGRSQRQPNLLEGDRRQRADREPHALELDDRSPDRAEATSRTGNEVRPPRRADGGPGRDLGDEQVPRLRDVDLARDGRVRPGRRRAGPVDEVEQDPDHGELLPRARALPGGRVALHVAGAPDDGLLRRARDLPAHQQ
jgi:hypothetical protein